jgi:hypothetical protein
VVQESGDEPVTIRSRSLARGSRAREGESSRP